MRMIMMMMMVTIIMMMMMMMVTMIMMLMMMMMMILTVQVIMSLERSVPESEAKQFLEAYSIALGPTERYSNLFWIEII